MGLFVGAVVAFGFEGSGLAIGIGMTIGALAGFTFG